MLVEFQNTTYKPEYGGIVNYINQLSNVMKNKSKFEVRIIASHQQKESSYHDNNILVLKHKRNKLNKFKKINSVKYRVQEIEQFLHKIYKNKKPDLVFSRHPFYAYVTKKLFPDVRVVFIQATALPLFTRMAISNKNFMTRGLIYRRYIAQIYEIEEEAMKLVDEIVVLSESKKKEISDFYGFYGNINVVPAGVDIKHFIPLSNVQKESLKKKYGLRTDKKTFLYVGRISYEKNVQELIEVFKKVDDNSQLLVVGDGPELSNLKSKIKKENMDKKVILLGYCSDPKEYYQLSDSLIHLAKYEGFGQVLVEAMSCGLPVIAYKQSYPEIIVASDEIIENGVTGHLVNDDQNEIKNLINNLKISDLSSMTHSCRRESEKKYSWERISGLLLDRKFNQNEE